MSIFDVIKYPVTNEFHEEELSALPPGVVNTWWCLDMTAGNKVEMIPVSNIRFHMCLTGEVFRNKSLALLKKRIAEL
jgi:hypothetical protein